MTHIPIVSLGSKTPSNQLISAEGTTSKTVIHCDDVQFTPLFENATPAKASAVPKTVIQCHGIHFAYEQDDGTPLPLMAGIDFTAQAGKIISIMGRSGCGKTTLLNMMNGLLSPQLGQVSVHAQRPVTIFQDKRLIPWMTIAQNVRFGARERGIRLSDDQVADALLDVGLSPNLADAYPKRLSGGMQQRVAIARALVCNPDVLFMDEPFSALDTTTKRDLMVRIAHYVERTQATAVLVTHDREEACALSHEIVQMRGLPATLTPLLSIDTLHDQRDETMINLLSKKLQTSVKQNNAVAFGKYGFVCGCSPDHTDGLVDFLTARQWQVWDIRRQKPGADFIPPEQQPDVVILYNNHLHFETIINHYHDRVTRILCVRRPTAEQIETWGFIRIEKTTPDLIDWWGWETIYADLIADAPKTKVTDIVIGHNWSFVATADGAGVGRSPCRGTEGARTIPNAGELLGCTVADLAQGLLSDDDLLRSLAIAGLASAYNPKAQGRTGELQWGFRLFKEGTGEKVCVGNFPPAKKLLPDIKIIEREPKDGHYTVEQGNDLLQSADYVVVTAQTLMNGTLPRILFLAQGADIMVLGPTAPLSPIWKKYGVRYVCGMRVTHAPSMRDFVAQAGTMLMLDHQAEKVTLEF